MGPNGEACRQQVVEEGRRHNIEVVDMVFPVCAKLKDLWIGDWIHIEAQRTQNGNVAKLVWRACPKRDIVFDRWATKS
jgi:hypothetical protein